MPPQIARLATAIVGVALIGLAGCGDTTEPPASPTQGSPFSPYVALGDSYTAVSGTDISDSADCLRSSSSYPYLLADRLAISEVKNVACGGAISDNLKGTQYPLRKSRQDPQFDALSDQTKLVTLGIGLNDQNYFISTVAPCFLLDGREQSVCAPFLARPRSYFLDLAASIGDQVAVDLEEIKQAAPNARVVFVGYPRFLPDNKGCPAQIPLAPKAVDLVRTSGEDVNNALKSAAKRTGADFIDMYEASRDHDVCSKQPWVNGQSTIAGQAYLFHPFPAYHEAVADKLAALLSN